MTGKLLAELLKSGKKHYKIINGILSDSVLVSIKTLDRIDPIEGGVYELLFHSEHTLIWRKDAVTDNGLPLYTPHSEEVVNAI